MYLLLILVSLAVVMAENTTLQDPMFPRYGVYCGFDLTNQYGKEPIDELDRYCQYHDICVTVKSQGRSSCWCNQQLYYLVSNIKPKSEKEDEAKNSILYYIYLAIAGCKNYYHFASNVKITQINFDNATKGYNYLPFYPDPFNKQSYVVKINSSSEGSAFLLKFEKSIYHDFTKSVYNNPIEGFVKYSKYIVHELTSKPRQITIGNDYYVIYNPSEEYEKTIHLVNDSICKYPTIDCDNNCGDAETAYVILTASTAILLIMFIIVAVIACRLRKDLKMYEI